MVTDHDSARVTLGVFEELIGTLQSIHHTDHELIIELSSGTLSFPVESRAAELCAAGLRGYEGERVSVFRTDNPDQPVRVLVHNHA